MRGACDVEIDADWMEAFATKPADAAADTKGLDYLALVGGGPCTNGGVCL